MLLLTLYVHAQTALATRRHHARAGRDRGQATAEYALVLLGAAAVAALLTGWAAKTGKIGDLLDFILGKLLGDAESTP